MKGNGKQQRYFRVQFLQNARVNRTQNIWYHFATPTEEEKEEMRLRREKICERAHTALGLSRSLDPTHGLSKHIMPFEMVMDCHLKSY